MIGCCVAWKCLVACRLGESSQQPTWPQVRQIRKCSHSLPLLRHSSQPSALGCTSRMPAIWVHPFATPVQASLVSKIRISAPPVAKLGTSAAVALPSALPKAFWTAAMLSKVNVAIR